MLAAALLWGLWWLPIRWVESLGITGLWPGVALCLGALPVTAALALWRRGPWPSRHTLAGAVLIGMAMMLYGGSLSFTDVVRAVLLFYLAPAWSILIEYVWLGRRFRAYDALALGCAIAGIAMITRGEIPLEGAGAVGDWMALLSGMAWSAGSALIFTGRSLDAYGISLMAVTAAALSGTAIALLAGDVAGNIGGGPAAVAAAAGAGALYTAPIILGTVWGAIRLAPATLSFLLTAEIISGVGSSALLLDEPFGWIELAGAILIIAGAMVEVFRPDGAAKADAPPGQLGA